MAAVAFPTICPICNENPVPDKTVLDLKLPYCQKCDNPNYRLEQWYVIGFWVGEWAFAPKDYPDLFDAYAMGIADRKGVSDE